MSNDTIFQFQTYITLKIYFSAKDDNSFLSESSVILTLGQ